MKFNFKVDMSPKLQKLMGVKIVNGKIYSAAEKDLVVDVRKEFNKRGPVKAKQAILQDVVKGISPVEGKGKFKKYSASYLQAIKGEAFLDENGEWVIFRWVNGRPRKIAVDAKKLTGRNYVQEAAGGMKKTSPVTLKLSGELHKSLYAITFGVGSAFRLVLNWKHYLAVIHNSEGAGKSKVIRRMLPTQSGERFNRKITKVIMDELKNSIDKVVKRIS